ncbi:hypothetical protein J2T07_003176 [Luteibacter jiangsuensis]|uniref:Uncharacterized protein n=1 Tax=Luteibacter jiangsuensis TaxID=637577 RepID=A0ABT9T118_9GAMM|nr:hypothetical protein [Luteibacter jiangsuensis]MDQ0010970.1 hypothetical protein [Luteibacter jiangsuensis]
MSRWKVIPVVVGLMASMGSGAQEVPGNPPFAVPDAGGHRGVIDDTWIIAPKRLADATLAAVKNYADEGDIAAGVSLRYHIDKADWIIADVFIYPAGEGDDATMLHRAAEDFRESVAYAERQQIYRNVWWGDEAAYTARLSGGKKLEGRFLPIVFDAQQDMLTSRTYLFYRKMYFVKIRLTTTVDAVDSLVDSADRFIGSLLGGVDIVSVGTCGKRMDVVSLAPGQSAPPDFQGGVSADGYRVAIGGDQKGTPAYASQMAKAMTLAVKRQLAAGCTTLDYNPPLQDDTKAVLHLAFGPDDWGASARP